MDANMLIDKLTDIWKVYENDNTRQYLYSLKIKLKVKQRSLTEAKDEIDKGLNFVSKYRSSLTLVYYLGFKALIQILSKDHDAAEKTLSEANDILSKEGYYIPHFLSTYLKATFLYEIDKLEEAMLKKKKAETKHHRNRTLKAGRRALNNAKKYAADRTEIYRLFGTFKWLTGRQNEAINWWKKSISQGELIGDRIETARAYLEMGARLSTKSSFQTRFEGIESQVCLEKANQMFRHLNLYRDVKEIERLLAA